MKSIILIFVFVHFAQSIFSQTIIAQQNFDGINTWTYSTSAGGAGVFDNTNTIGVSATNGMGYYYNSYLTGASGYTSSMTFNAVNTTGYASVKIKFRMAWGGTYFGTDGSSGTGIDTDDYVEILASRNGGAFGRVWFYNGYSNRMFAHNTSTRVLAYNANISQRADAAGNIGSIEITFPAATTSVNLQLIVKCNRVHENFYFDDFIVEGVSSLPVELVNFEAACSNHTTELSWVTVSETNNDYFTIEAANAANADFFPIAVIDGAGNSNQTIQYQYSDINNYAYYRLKQTDFDGRFTYASVCAAHCGVEERWIYPNVVQCNEVVHFQGDAEKLQVFDQSGRAVKVHVIDQQLFFSQSGIYFVSVNGSEVQRVIVL